MKMQKPMIPAVFARCTEVREFAFTSRGNSGVKMTHISILATDSGSGIGRGLAEALHVLKSQVVIEVCVEKVCTFRSAPDHHQADAKRRDLG